MSLEKETRRMWLRDLLTRIPEPIRPSRRASRVAGTAWRLEEPSTSFEAVPERFVQDIWYGRLFDASRVTTTDGHAIRILDTGIPNRDRGPDFKNARVRISEVDWRGDIEIHVRSSDWVAHRHDTDIAYDSVILHVTLLADIWTGRLKRQDGSSLPEVVLMPFLGQPVRSLFRKLRRRPASDAIACSAQLRGVPRDLLTGWIEKLGLERMRERKRLLAQNVRAAGGLDGLLYHAVFEALGYSKNGQQMLDLARRVSLAVLQGCDQTDREALLLGAAGLLHAENAVRRKPETQAVRPDVYVSTLRSRFAALPEAQNLVKMRSVSWSFFRLRPANFPTLRIAQGASLVQDRALLGPGAIGRIRDIVSSDNGLRGLRDLFASTPSEYWNKHVRLEREAALRSPTIGRSRIDRILLNAVLPVLLLLAEQSGDRKLARAVFRIYARLPAELDDLVRMFSASSVAAESAIQSQGLHQLYRSRCQTGGCFSCAVGRFLLTSTGLANQPDTAVEIRASERSDTPIR